MKISKLVCSLSVIAFVGSGCPSGTSVNIVNRSGSSVIYHSRDKRKVNLSEGSAIGYNRTTGLKIQKGDMCYMYGFIERIDTLMSSDKYNKYIKKCYLTSTITGFREFNMILDQNMRVFVSDDCNRIRYSEEQPEGFPVSPEIVPCG